VGIVAANNPMTDETGQQIMAAVQQLNQVVAALTVQVAELSDSLAEYCADRQHLAASLQSGKPYTPSSGAGY
jgi:hypothetical protein